MGRLHATREEVMRIAHEIFDDAIQIESDVFIPNEVSDIAGRISQAANNLMIVAEAIKPEREPEPTKVD